MHGKCFIYETSCNFHLQSKCVDKKMALGFESLCAMSVIILIPKKLFNHNKITITNANILGEFTFYMKDTGNFQIDLQEIQVILRYLHDLAVLALRKKIYSTDSKLVRKHLVIINIDSSKHSSLNRKYYCDFGSIVMYTGRIKTDILQRSSRNRKIRKIQ